MFVFIMIRNSIVPHKSDRNIVDTNITYLEITDLTCNITLWDPRHSCASATPIKDTLCV